MPGLIEHLPVGIRERLKPRIGPDDILFTLRAGLSPDQVAQYITRERKLRGMWTHDTADLTILVPDLTRLFPDGKYNYRRINDAVAARLQLSPVPKEARDEIEERVPKADEISLKFLFNDKVRTITVTTRKGFSKCVVGGALATGAVACGLSPQPSDLTPPPAAPSNGSPAPPNTPRPAENLFNSENINFEMLRRNGMILRQLLSNSPQSIADATAFPATPTPSSDTPSYQYAVERFAIDETSYDITVVDPNVIDFLKYTVAQSPRWGRDGGVMQLPLKNTEGTTAPFAGLTYFREKLKGIQEEYIAQESFPFGVHFKKEAGITIVGRDYYGNYVLAFEENQPRDNAESFHEPRIRFAIITTREMQRLQQYFSQTTTVDGDTIKFKNGEVKINSISDDVMALISQDAGAAWAEQYPSAVNAENQPELTQYKNPVVKHPPKDLLDMLGVTWKDLTYSIPPAEELVKNPLGPLYYTIRADNEVKNVHLIAKYDETGNEWVWSFPAEAVNWATFTDEKQHPPGQVNSLDLIRYITAIDHKARYAIDLTFGGMRFVYQQSQDLMDQNTLDTHKALREQIAADIDVNAVLKKQLMDSYRAISQSYPNSALGNWVAIIEDTDAGKQITGFVRRNGGSEPVTRFKFDGSTITEIPKVEELPVRPRLRIENGQLFEEGGTDSITLRGAVALHFRYDSPDPSHRGDLSRFINDIRILRDAGGNTIKVAFNGSWVTNDAYIEKLITACEIAAEMGFRVILSLDTEDIPNDTNNVRTTSIQNKETRDGFWKWLGDRDNASRIKRCVDAISPINEPHSDFENNNIISTSQWKEIMSNMVDYIRQYVGSDYICLVSPNEYAGDLIHVPNQVIDRTGILLDIHPYKKLLWITWDQHYTVDSLPQIITRYKNRGIPVIFSEYGYHANSDSDETTFSQELVTKVIKPLNVSALRYGLVSEAGTLSLLDEDGNLRTQANRDDWTSTLQGMTA